MAPKPEEITLSTARARSAVLMARRYITMQPSSHAVPHLKSLIDIAERQIELINAFSTATGE